MYLQLLTAKIQNYNTYVKFLKQWSNEEHNYFCHDRIVESIPLKHFQEP